jgi:hypothetical protein
MSQDKNDRRGGNPIATEPAPAADALRGMALLEQSLQEQFSAAVAEQRRESQKMSGFREAVIQLVGERPVADQVRRLRKLEARQSAEKPAEPDIPAGEDRAFSA